MKTLTITSEALADVIVKTFNNDFWTEKKKDNFLDATNLLLAELDGGCADLYTEACEIAKRRLQL